MHAYTHSRRRNNANNTIDDVDNNGTDERMCERETDVRRNNK